MHVELMYPNDYLKAPDFRGKDVTLTIKRVFQDDLKDMKGGKKKKYIVEFNETQKKLVLNVTNARAIAKKLDEPKAIKWAGKQITLFPTTCEAFGEIKECIRVKQ
jgi:hypothetical protein